jgi:hypothetical protein
MFESAEVLLVFVCPHANGTFLEVRALSGAGGASGDARFFHMQRQKLIMPTKPHGCVQVFGVSIVSIA